MTTPPPQGQNPFAQGQQPYPPQGYAQQPGQQGVPQQPGQPGAPQQPYPPMAQGPAPVPPQQQRPKRSMRTYLRIAGAVIVVIAAVGGWIASRDDANTAAVGDCMHVSNPDNPTDPDLEVVDCGDSKAQYKVAMKKEDDSGCDRTKYAEYTETGDGDSFTLCLTEYKP